MKPKARSKKSTKLSPAAQKARKAENKSTDVTKTITSLLQRSRAALEDGEVESAHAIASRACLLLPKDSTDVQAIELLGELDIELEKFEEATECFMEAIKRRGKVDPETFELGEEAKFLWMGQLSTGEESQEWYLRGIEVLQRILEGTTDDEQRKKIKEKLSTGYCSVTELFLTDLWYGEHLAPFNGSMTEQAEQNAEKYGLLAIEHDPESPVALALLASVRLSQTQDDEATDLLKQSVTQLFGRPGVKPPPYPDRLHLVKLLIEVEMYDKGLEVLEMLQREDEDNVELWYYYTVAYFSDNQESKEENWKNARECAETCLKLYQRMEWDDDQLRDGCLEMLEEIKNSGISIDKGEDEDGEVEDEWEDSEGDVEMEDAS
jgi:tetratricopeptide (TPR) repeat protein